MFFAVVTNIATIGIGLVLLWGWVAFISEVIARRTGRKYAVPYPDEVLWARFGRFFLDRGLFGGVPVRTQRLRGILLLRWLRGRLARSKNIATGEELDAEANVTH